MIPLEVVVRGVAAGSFVKRNPSDHARHAARSARGRVFLQGRCQPRSADHARSDRRAAASRRRKRSASMSEIARLTFDILSHAWRRRDVLLVDLKIEFGRSAGGENQGQLVIADVIDNDSWRIWPQGREELMLDKQMYRNLPKTSTMPALARVKQPYERVAEMVGTFPVMRPGMVAVIADGPAQRRARERDRGSARAARPADRPSRRESGGDAGLRAAARGAARSDLRAAGVRRRRRTTALLRDARMRPRLRRYLDGSGDPQRAGAAVREDLRPRRHGARSDARCSCRPTRARA